MVSVYDFLPEYPLISDSNFQQEIFNKQEFFDKRLTRDLEIPSDLVDNGLLNHQVLVQRYISSHSFYDELLVYHEMGTGKSRVAFAITEGLKKTYRRAYILTRGPDLLITLMRELVRFAPATYPTKTLELAELRRVTGQFYDFRTFDALAKELELKEDSVLLEQFNDCIFIVDEVHNIKADENARIYRQFWRLFHLLPNRRVVLLSGTPMVDTAGEIAYLMNLLLPADQQMPTGNEFTREFVTGDRLKNVRQLDPYFRGRISFLRAAATARTRYMGNSSEPIPQFRLFETQMGLLQSEAYRQAYELDARSEQRTIYTNSRQAQLFVFPDGSWGTEGQSKYLTPGGALRAPFATYVSNMENLDESSSKYAFIVQNILDNPTKCVYVYCNIVNGSGANLFARILERYGFRRYNRNSPESRERGRRYILLTSQTQHIAETIQYFNRPENAHGDYCQVIIGSRKISEGFTFKNIQIIHITTLFWNDTETAQAVARGIRYGSHNDLGPDVRVDIYRHASIPQLLLEQDEAETVSVDLLMNQTARDKDILIRHMDRVIKENAFDCPLTFERNLPRNATAGSRPCDYGPCQYQCRTFTGPGRTEEDYSTFALYYAQRGAFLDGLISFFYTRYTSTFEELARIFAPPTEMLLLQALDYLISEPVALTHQDGRTYYLKEFQNEYFLITDIRLFGFEALLAFSETRAPTFSERVTFSEVGVQLQDISLNQLATKLGETTDLPSLRALLESQTIQVQRRVLENALWLRAHDQVTPRVRWVEELYAPFIVPQTEYPFVIDMGGQQRCYNPQTRAFVDCVVDRLDLEQPNEYGFIGITSGDKFCIKDLARRGAADLRLRNTGANCMEVGWNKNKLAQLLIRLQVPLPDERWKSIQLAQVPESTSQHFQPEYSAEERQQFTYWFKQGKRILCQTLRAWFAGKNLLFEGPCGRMGKTKARAT